MNIVLGIIKVGCEINKTRLRHKYVYVQCPICKKYRWADLTSYKNSGGNGNYQFRCGSCNSVKQGKKNNQNGKVRFNRYT